MADAVCGPDSAGETARLNSGRGGKGLGEAGAIGTRGIERDSEEVVGAATATITARSGSA